MTPHKGLYGRAYSLVCRTTLDELPIGLYSSKKTAMHAAKEVTEKDIDKAAELMKVDSAGVCNLAIISYMHGAPTGFEIVRQAEEIFAVAPQGKDS